LRLLAFKSPQQPSADTEKKSLKSASPELSHPSAISNPSAPKPISSGLVSPPPVAVAAPLAGSTPTPLPQSGAPAAEHLPPGRQVPVRDTAASPSMARSDSPQSAASGGGSIPVRDLGPAAERLDKPQAPTELVLVTSEEGDFWQALVQQMVAAERITALVRELALQSQLVGRDTQQWLLRTERESLHNPIARERLEQALADSGHAVRLTLEVGRVMDSPAKRAAALAAQRQREAEAIILHDPFVQKIMRQFDAKIVPGSLKPA